MIDSGNEYADDLQFQVSFLKFPFALFGETQNLPCIAPSLFRLVGEVDNTVDYFGSLVIIWVKRRPSFYYK